MDELFSYIFCPVYRNYQSVHYNSLPALKLDSYTSASYLSNRLHPLDPLKSYLLCSKEQ